MNRELYLYIKSYTFNNKVKNRKIYILKPIHLMMIKGSNKYEKLAELLQGFYTIETLAERLKIDRAKAIYVIHRLRKLGYVKTVYGAERKRTYYISLKNKQKAITLTEKINNASPSLSASYAIVVPSDAYHIHGRDPSYEEALIYAIKRRSVRYIIAGLVLFRRISDWSLLYKLAKKEKLIVEVAALYDVARKVVNKVRRMPKRFLSLAKKRKTKRFSYIIKPLSSEDFKDIEKKWHVYIPLNYADLEEYKK